MIVLVRFFAIVGVVLLSGLQLPAQAAGVGNLKKIETTDQAGVLQLDTDTGNVLQISVLKADLFRVRAGVAGHLTDAGDKAAPIVLPHNYPKIDYQLSDQGQYQLLHTAAFALRIYKKPLHLALYRADNQSMLWQEIRPMELSEKASYQVLSSTPDEAFFGGGQQNGAFSFKGKLLEVSYSGGWEEGDRPSPAPFYMSSKGYGVLRNTWSNGSYDFRSDDYITTSHEEQRFDAYYFVGADIHDVLSAYTELTGRAHLLPRWAFEYGDADCYNDGDNVKKPGTVPQGWSDGPTGTTPDVIQSVAAKYREYDMPGGWILPNDGYGCGYTNLPAVVAGLAHYGFHTGLWTESGVAKIAGEVGVAGTRAQKLDVAWTGQGYQFSLDANMAAAQGILDNSDARPFVWTVMGWAGTQRYAVTWTGDQSGSWDYIRWHIPTLIGSGLSGQAYASGDVDGIFGGSPETFTRDLQWKSFTPVLMGMSGWSQIERKHPWWFDEPYRSINRTYLKLKMRLTPYMYTYAKQAEESGAPLVRGLMWDHPSDPHALDENYKYQFFLGRDFLVAPVYRSQSASHGWRKGIYLPQGQWIDYWDGRVVTAPAQGKVIDYAVTLDKLPVLVRAGAIIPMYPTSLYDGQVPKDVLTWDIYPYGHSDFTLYEDDGITRQYQQGQSSRQTIHVDQPSATKLTVQIDAVQGSYQGMPEQRIYQLQLHTRVRPESVSANDGVLPEMHSNADFDHATSGWYYDANHQYGVLYVKTDKVDVRKPVLFNVQLADVAPQATADYPDAPDIGNAIPADSLLVVNRPAEEPGHPLENALDCKPDTWFRTVRDQSQKTGPHEFTLALGERRMVNGFEIAPRNDKNWMYGQVRDVEVYLSDNNGDWGKPVFHGALQKQQGVQKIEFPAKAGRLFRFRVLSTWDQDDAGNPIDPMVLAATASGAAYNGLNSTAVSPITISEFRVLEQPVPNRPKQQFYLSDVAGKKEGVSRDKVNAAHAANAEHVMQMNGLKFYKGLGVAGATKNSQIDFTLAGNWQTFRADVGIDDACRDNGGMTFQVWGDDKLLFSSGVIKAPAVVKPELDIRGVQQLTLKTITEKSADKSKAVCANWANAALIGFQDDRVLK